PGVAQQWRAVRIDWRVVVPSRALVRRVGSVVSQRRPEVGVHDVRPTVRRVIQLRDDRIPELPYEGREIRADADDEMIAVVEEREVFRRGRRPNGDPRVDLLGHARVGWSGEHDDAIDVMERPDQRRLPGPLGLAAKRDLRPPRRSVIFQKPRPSFVRELVAEVCEKFGTPVLDAVSSLGLVEYASELWLW